ncbi:1-deoxy-D-xylulose-5-phosphate synthase [Anopheles sinensis]|uniref:1-deoxy-D-xylulose-5-phosphate synthase n=1 Tax=Anopheles sinensis TaxID=74873 RepID=A0A084W7I8_ANOSI|nr:1-deoxy-D-xylulose-5-phosphate synthase [Anopheles sinensis]
MLIERGTKQPTTHTPRECNRFDCPPARFVSARAHDRATTTTYRLKLHTGREETVPVQLQMRANCGTPRMANRNHGVWVDDGKCNCSDLPATGVPYIAMAMIVAWRAVPEPAINKCVACKTSCCRWCKVVVSRNAHILGSSNIGILPEATFTVAYDVAAQLLPRILVVGSLPEFTCHMLDN